MSERKLFNLDFLLLYLKNIRHNKFCCPLDLERYAKEGLHTNFALILRIYKE